MLFPLTHSQSQLEPTPLHMSARMETDQIRSESDSIEAVDVIYIVCVGAIVEGQAASFRLFREEMLHAISILMNIAYLGLTTVGGRGLKLQIRGGL